MAVTVGEFAVNAVVGGALTGAAEKAGEALGSRSLGPATGAVSQGSANVLINGLPAGRVGDAESCHAGLVAQGSSGVFINGRPAARAGDKTTCGAVIVSGSANVFIGGGVTTRLPIQSEVPQWARWAAVVIGLLPALGGAARALASGIAEVAETGLARAAQTGVKALGRAMEERAGKFSPELEAQAQRLGVSTAKLKSIVDTPKLYRPPPDDYLSAQRLSDHAEAFKDGASRITLQKNIDKYGLGQSDGTTFVMTPTEADNVIQSSGGDPRALEKALGLPDGQLDSSKLVRIDFTPQAMSDLNMRMPSGKEAGANSQWMPGGFVPSGANEAVIDGGSTQPSHYIITPVN